MKRARALAFRLAEDADTSFVVDSWLDSFRTAHAAGLIAMDDWRDVMGPQVVKMLRRPGVSVVVAYRPGEEGTGADLYGWAAVEVRIGAPPLVLYVYVKQAYRRMGIARRLLQESGVDLAREWHYASKTPIVTKLSPKISRARWTPLAARHPSTTPAPGESVGSYHRTP